MTRKHDIRAPRKPAGENPAITIANQNRQIKVLLDRCEELRIERDMLKGQSEIKDGLLEEQREQYADLSDAYSRLSGYQDCCREIFGVLGMPLIAPGA